MNLIFPHPGVAIIRGGEERRRQSTMNHLDDYDRPRMKTSLVNGDAGSDRDASRGRKMGTAGQQEVDLNLFKAYFGGKFKLHDFSISLHRRRLSTTRGR